MRCTQLLLALLLLPVSLAGQQAGDPSARIDAALQSARAAGVPGSLLRSRIAEGQAKGVPIERIAAAIESRARALVRASDLMRSTVGSPSDADLSSTADALEAGIGAEAVADIARASRVEDRPVAIAVLTYLHAQQGMPVEQAMAQVRAAMQRSPEALRTLPSQAAANGRGWGGAPPHAGPPARGIRGNGAGTGPPQGVPGPGQRPGRGGRPDSPGNPDDNPGAGPRGGAGGPPSSPGAGRP